MTAKPTVTLEDRKSLPALPSALQNQRRLLSTTLRTWAAVSTAAGSLGDTARTNSSVPVVVVYSLWVPCYRFISNTEEASYRRFRRSPMPSRLAVPPRLQDDLRDHPPLQIHLRLFSCTPSTLAMVSTAAGALVDKTRTSCTVSKLITWSPSPPISSISPISPTTATTDFFRPSSIATTMSAPLEDATAAL
ncbi:hypothetical protein ARMGADRAFT_1093501 [Armillaria gallica]|uniref:Uncharacterized protein n=1 Tax=Armillaria gallica TaxID=47427 RepID=A0A2H3C7M1_ARMGA|nr:hypothetical protein ARMGADRAFT_1093501 [Armillaria gallica]